MVRAYIPAFLVFCGKIGYISIVFWFNCKCIQCVCVYAHLHVKPFWIDGPCGPTHGVLETQFNSLEIDSDGIFESFNISFQLLLQALVSSEPTKQKNTFSRFYTEWCKRW
jgi:hypothetical protein